MTKSNIVLLIVSLVLVTVTSVLLFLEGLATFGSFDAIYKPGNNGWDAVGGIFLFIYVLILAFFAVASAVATLPFDIILMKKAGKRWFNLAILIFSIAAIFLAVAMAAALPIVVKASEALKESSSSSSVSSAL